MGAGMLCPTCQGLPSCGVPASTIPSLTGRLPARPQVPRLRAEASQRVLRALAAAYATVHQALSDPASGYQAEEVQQAVPYTPAQMATLLGVAGQAGGACA